MNPSARLTPNNDPATATEFPWCLRDHHRCLALFAEKSVGQEVLRAGSRLRQAEDDASRYRAMYLGAASFRRTVR